MWPPHWKRIAHEAEESFQYMMKHDLIQGDNIDHFCIYSANRTLYPYSTEFHNAYASDVERKIIPWIREEEKSGYLRDRERWRPFRDSPYYERSLMGYHRLFVYESAQIPTRDPHVRRGSFGPCEVLSNGKTPRLLRVYFMLAIAPFCYYECDSDGNEACATCFHNCDVAGNPHFVAALYGWEEDDTPCLKPYVHVEKYDKVLVDLQMPVVSATFWNSSGDDSADWKYTTSDDSDSSSSIE